MAAITLNNVTNYSVYLEKNGDTVSVTDGTITAEIPTDAASKSDVTALQATIETLKEEIELLKTAVYGASTDEGADSSK